MEESKDGNAYNVLNTFDDISSSKGQVRCFDADGVRDFVTVE